MNYRIPAIVIAGVVASQASAADLRLLTVQGYEPAPSRNYRDTGFVSMPPISSTVTALVDWDAISQSYPEGGQDNWLGIATDVPVTYSENGEIIFSREATVYFVNGSGGFGQDDLVRVNFDFYIETYRDSYIESWLTLPIGTLSTAGLDTMEGLLADYSTYSSIIKGQLFYASIEVYEEGNPLAVYTYRANASFTGYSLTSIPEPSTYTVLAGFAVLGLVATRRRRTRA